MESLSYPPYTSQRPLRAMIEITDGELKIFPVASSELEERRIMDGLRFFREAWDER